MNKIISIVILMLIYEASFAEDKISALVKEFKKGFSSPNKGSLTITEECMFKVVATPLWQTKEKTIIASPAEFSFEKNAFHSDTAYLTYGEDTIFILKGNNRDELVKNKKLLITKILGECGK